MIADLDTLLTALYVELTDRIIPSRGLGRRGPVRGLVREHLPGLLAFAVQFRVGQPEPGDGPVAGADDEQLGAPVPAGMAGAVAVPGPSEQGPSGER